MEQGRALIKEFSDDIQMSFGQDKCTVIHMKRGKVSESTETREIPLLTGDDDYKYLGVMESNMILHEKEKTKAKKEFTKRVREILKKELNGKNTADAIRTYAMPILRYGFGILKWGKAELSSPDRKYKRC